MTVLAIAAKAFGCVVTQSLAFLALCQLLQVGLQPFVGQLPLEASRRQFAMLALARTAYELVRSPFRLRNLASLLVGAVTLALGLGVWLMTAYQGTHGTGFITAPVAFLGACGLVRSARKQRRLITSGSPVVARIAGERAVAFSALASASDDLGYTWGGRYAFVGGVFYVVATTPSSIAGWGWAFSGLVVGSLLHQYLCHTVLRGHDLNALPTLIAAYQGYVRNVRRLSHVHEALTQAPLQLQRLAEEEGAELSEEDMNELRELIESVQTKPLTETDRDYVSWDERADPSVFWRLFSKTVLTFVGGALPTFARRLGADHPITQHVLLLRQEVLATHAGAPLSPTPPARLSHALTDISILCVGAAECPAYYTGLEMRRPRGELQELPSRKSRFAGMPDLIAVIRDTAMNLIAVVAIIAALAAAAKTLSLDPLLRLR